MLLTEKLKNYHIILASSSPRRQQFLEDLGLPYEIQLKPVEETYPTPLKGAEIADYIADLKTTPYRNHLRANDLLITGDTIVWDGKQVMHKPKDKDEAYSMLQTLANNKHQVISSVCLCTSKKKVVFHGETTVHFSALTPDEINYYIDNFSPFDKTGAYGIQEWIGKIGITKIEGSYYNVMGMPVDKLYRALKTF